MEIQVLKNFLLVAKEGNITRAAEILHLSQPTLSRQIQNLESEFGCQLFTRDSRKLSLTNQGMLLQQRAAGIIDLYERTQSEMNPIPEVISGDIRIGICEASSVRSVLNYGKKFHDAYPLTRLRVTNGYYNTVAEMIGSGLVDFGLLFGRVDDNMFDSVEINQKERFCLLMPEGHPLSEKELLDASDINGYSLIIYQDAARELPVTFGNYFQDLSISATFTTMLTAIQLVKAGLGLAVILNNMIGTRIMDGPDVFVTRPLSIPVRVPTYLAWRKSGDIPRQASLFLQEFIKSF